MTRTIMFAMSAALVFGILTNSCSKKDKENTAATTTHTTPDQAPDQEKSDDKHADKGQGKETKTAFQTLDILPEGSILRRVRLPRYDEDFNPISLLTAEKLTVLDKDQIEAEGITIELYDKDGSIQARSKMNRAIYSQKDSTLIAKQAVFIEGNSYKASGTGLFYDWKTGQGFLLGPTSTLFQVKELDLSKDSEQAPHEESNPSLK